jgi:hypothetical protein
MEHTKNHRYTVYHCLVCPEVFEHPSELMEHMLAGNSQISTGFGNLSIKNRLRDRFSCSKCRQVTGQRFSRPKFRQGNRTGFSDGDRILDRFSSRTGPPSCLKDCLRF